MADRLRIGNLHKVKKYPSQHFLPVCCSRT